MTRHLHTWGWLTVAWIEIAALLALLLVYSGERQTTLGERETAPNAAPADAECYHRAPVALSRAAGVTPAPGTSEAAFGRDCRP